MIKNFQNKNTELFLSRCERDDYRAWVWLAIQAIRNEYPNADFWSTGGADKKYVDLRVGQKSVGKSSGWPVLYFWLSSQGIPFLHVHKDLRGFSTLQEPICRESHPTIEQLSEWCQALRALNITKTTGLNGGGHNPVKYLLDMQSTVSEDQELGIERELDVLGSVPLNQILYGPPGTGKTYSTTWVGLEPTRLSVGDFGPPPFALSLSLAERRGRQTLEAKKTPETDIRGLGSFWGKGRVAGQLPSAGKGR